MSDQQRGYEAASQPCSTCGWDCEPICGFHPMGCIFSATSTTDEGGWFVAPECQRRHPTFVPDGMVCWACGADEGELHNLKDEIHSNPAWTAIGSPHPPVPGSEIIQ